MKNSLIIFFVVVCCLTVLWNSGCTSEYPPPPPDGPSPCEPRNGTPFGTGTLSFTTTLNGVKDSLLLNGNYVASNQFVNDTFFVQGAGGYARNTSAAQKGLVAGFVHRPSGGSVYERIIAFSIFGPAIDIKTYSLVRSDATPAGAYVKATFLLADSLNPPYTIYTSKVGSFIISALDTCSQHLAGTFSGTFQGLPPDTTKIIQITNGKFDITYVDNAFSY